MLLSSWLSGIAGTVDCALVMLLNVGSAAAAHGIGAGRPTADIVTDEDQSQRSSVVHNIYVQMANQYSE